MVITHLIVDTRDAMGANTVNTMAERLAPDIEAWTGGKVYLRILSNLADRRLARARATWTAEAIGGEAVRDGMISAFRFAAADPYRAATHNKGIMNGVSAVVLATGNDTRAVEAGAHAYAARSGRYTSLTSWEASADGALTGTIELPMPVGLVGGATKVHPTAQACLKILGVGSAAELARIIAAVGLAQNFGAMKALATVGIQQGHMALHAHNVAIAAGAIGPEVEQLAAILVGSAPGPPGRRHDRARPDARPGLSRTHEQEERNRPCPSPAAPCWDGHGRRRPSRAARPRAAAGAEDRRADRPVRPVPGHHRARPAWSAPSRPCRTSPRATAWRWRCSPPTTRTRPTSAPASPGSGSTATGWT